MTIKQVITQLKSQGYKVEAYKRKDGGYLIKSINGQKFKGAAGNEMARLFCMYLQGRSAFFCAFLVDDISKNKKRRFEKWKFCCS